MSCKTTVTEEGIKVMAMDKLNEIKGGSVNGQDAWVFYSPWGGCIVEMNSAIADGFDHSMFYRSMIVSGLWDKTETFEEIEKQIGGKLCEDAKRALLSANIRGVQVALYWHDKDFEDEATDCFELLNKQPYLEDVCRQIINLPQKEWEKVQKILNKYGN
jgi:hypothetical protein